MQLHNWKYWFTSFTINFKEGVNPFVNNKLKAKKGSVCHKSKRDDVLCEGINLWGNKFHSAEGEVNIACVLLVFTSIV